MMISRSSRTNQGDNWSKIGQNASVSKSNWLHVEFVQFCLDQFEVYSTYSSKMIGNFPKLLNSNRLYFKLDWLNL